MMLSQFHSQSHSNNNDRQTNGRTDGRKNRQLEIQTLNITFKQITQQTKQI